ncbi:MAG: hypothetical protein QF662_02330, partial [Phycisphaerae bacterium]|nr:hypothetical protein [Phycisphaerae bacterium]
DVDAQDRTILEKYFGHCVSAEFKIPWSALKGGKAGGELTFMGRYWQYGSAVPFTIDVPGSAGTWVIWAGVALSLCVVAAIIVFAIRRVRKQDERWRDGRRANG